MIVEAFYSVHDGFMRMMTLREPHLSEFIARYKTLGYDVELLPYADDDTKDVSVEDYATLYVRWAKPPPDPGGDQASAR